MIGSEELWSVFFSYLLLFLHIATMHPITIGIGCKYHRRSSPVVTTINPTSDTNAVIR